MALLTSDDLTILRAGAAEVLTETVKVQRVTRTQDSYGGWTETWATVATVKGRLRAVPGREAPTGGKVGATFRYDVSLPNGTDVLPGDRLVVSGRTFEVAGVATPRSDEVLRRATAVEVR